MKAHSLEEPGGKRGSVSAAGELACAGGPVGVKPLHRGGACRPSRGQRLARRLGRGRRAVRWVGAPPRPGQTGRRQTLGLVESEALPQPRARCLL